MLSSGLTSTTGKPETSTTADTSLPRPPTQRELTSESSTPPEDSEASWVAVTKMGDDPHTPALRRDHLPSPTEDSEASWTTRIKMDSTVSSYRDFPVPLRAEHRPGLLSSTFAKTGLRLTHRHKTPYKASLRAVAVRPSHP